MSIQFGKFGDEIDADPGVRDATHVSCVLVRCDEDVVPGDHLRLVLDTLVDKCHVGDEFHGIADPFATKTIPARQAFWMLLRPCFVSNVTHQFDIVIGGQKMFSEDDDTYNECRGCK